MPKRCKINPKWLKKGVRLVRVQYLTVESLTLNGFWARQDNGYPNWIPMDQLGLVWNKLRTRSSGGSSSKGGGSDAK
jgi:hypothetical protein